MIRQTLQGNIKHDSYWKIEKFADDAAASRGDSFDTIEWEGNLGLNEGIDEVCDLICTTGSPTAFSNAAARLGVGDSATAAAAAQTGLQAPTNKLFKAMLAGYPTTTSQQMVFKSSFAGGEANYAWQEFTVVNAADDTGKNLVRKVSDQGTKTSGQIWTLQLTITMS